MNKHLKSRVIVISDDLYYLQGLCVKLARNNLFVVDSFFHVHGVDDIDFSLLHYDDRFVKNIIIVALDDFNIISQIPEPSRFLTFISLRRMKNRNVLFSIHDKVFLSRYARFNELLKLIHPQKISRSVKAITLTKFEWDVYSAYFLIDNRRILRALLKKDVKYISHYKISTFNKLEIDCDSDGYHIFKVLIQLRSITDQRNITFD